MFQSLYGIILRESKFTLPEDDPIEGLKHVGEILYPFLIR